MKYKCDNCGKEHQDFPALVFSTPTPYLGLTEKEKQTIAKLSSDFCVIEYDDQIDWFVRVVLKQKINDSCQFLEYGVWVSLSEESFEDYKNNFNNLDYEMTYFGWLCNHIPEYNDTMNLGTTVITQTENQRPIIELQKDNDWENEFVKDYFEGITEDEAARRIRNMMNQFNPN